MLNISIGSISHRFSRRTLLQAGATALGVAGAKNLLAIESDKVKTQKPIVFIRLDGGASLFDMFEMIPHAGVDQIYEPISSSVPGLPVSEHLPYLASQMHRMMLIKSLTHSEGTHFDAQAIMTIGDKKTTGTADDTDYKHPGRFIELRNQQYSTSALGNVVIDSSYGFKSPVGLVDSLEAHSKKREDGTLTNPFGEPSQNAERRQEIRELINRFEEHSHLNAPETNDFIASREAGYNTLEKDLGRAFDLESISESDRRRYGTDELSVFAKSALTARKLIEKGVPIVSIAHGDFDYHAGIKNYLTPHLERIDKPLASLVEDIELLGGMTVITTEFGRSPKVNDGAGRHHWTEANFGLISGLHPGRVVGKIDSGGKAVYPLAGGKFLPTAIYAAGYSPLYVRSNNGVLTSVKVDGFAETELKREENQG